MRPTEAIVLAAAMASSLSAGDARLLWSGPEVSLLGGVSRDGRFLSFADRASGDLAVRSLDPARTGVRWVTRQDARAQAGEFAYFSALAPDASRAAFAWFNADGFYELRVAPVPEAGAAPGPARTLYRNPEAGFVQPCAWSPDGAQILTLLFRRDNISQIALVSAETGETRVLRSLNWVYPKRMDLSPDGRWIVYDNLSADGADDRDLYLLATDGSAERRLTGGPANDVFPLWSPDGAEVFFASDRAGANALWAVSVSGGEPRLVRRDAGRLIPLGFDARGGLVHGQRIGGTELRAVPLDGRPAQALPAPAETDLFAPAISPDGARLAFLARVRSENFGEQHRTLVVRALDGGGDREIRARMAHIEAVRWSPDGASLLLSGSDHRARAGVFLHALDSGRTSPVALDPAAGIRGLEADFGPGGATVVYARGPQLIERTLEGGGEKVVAEAAAGRKIALPAVSPDGQRVAYAEVEAASGARGAVYVGKMTGGEPARLLELPQGRFIDLVWAPGDDLLVGSAGKQGSKLWRVPASGDRIRPMETPADRTPGIAVDPGGAHIVYAAGQAREEVRTLDGLAPVALGAGR